MNILAGQYDIEAHQHETLDLFISYVSDKDKVQDFSATFPGTNNQQYALIFHVRPKPSMDVEDNDIVLDSINRFQISEWEGADGSFDDNWLGKSPDSTPTVGQAELHLTPVSDESNLSSTTLTIKIPNAVMREMEPGNYYYSLVLVKKSSDAIEWNNVFTDDASAQETDILMTGKFRVMSSMNRNVETE